METFKPLINTYTYFTNIFSQMDGWMDGWTVGLMDQWMDTLSYRDAKCI